MTRLIRPTAKTTLYAAVFREYLHAMLAKGFPIAYFIEGGRSRSGRTLAPKGGMLGMTIESYMRDHPRPLLLVPVHFSYEKLLEVFWHNTDPTVIDRQFCDVGSQYRPAIFFHSEEQRLLALKSKEALGKTKSFKEPIVT